MRLLTRYSELSAQRPVQGSARRPVWRTTDISLGKLYVSLRKTLRYQVDLMQARARWVKLRFEGSPVLFGNAIPKSGSKLLLQILRGLQKAAPLAPVQPRPVRMITIDGKVRDLGEVLEDLRRLDDGDIGWGYVHSTRETLELLTQKNWVSFFLIRDPRDVLVSHVHYATDMYEGHSMRPYYLELPDFGARLAVAIKGTQSYPYLPSALGRYEPFLGFMDEPRICTLRFEDLRTDLRGTVEGMLDHIETSSELAFKDRSSCLDTVVQTVNPGRSPTFRKGAVGEWQQHFTDEHKEMFKSETGDLLVRLGYEQDEDW